MEALVHWFSQNLSQYISPEGAVFIISMIPILELRGGILAAVRRFKYPDLACNPNLSGREPDPNSVYPASDPSDFCMAAQDAPFPAACRKSWRKKAMSKK